MKTFTELFNTLLTADEETSRQAAREVRKLVYTTLFRSKYKCVASIIENAPAEYVKIIEDWRQENFVMAISVMYFLHNRENQPDFLFPWLFQLLQHPNGYIRHAAVKMISHEIGPLTYHLRFPGEASSFHEITPGDADIILRSLLASLNGLLTALWQPKYKRHKYVDSLPAGPYKSAQMVLAELKESCGKKYIDRLADYFNG